MKDKTIHMIIAAIFDLDGTLVDSFEGYLLAYNRAFAAKGLKLMTPQDLGKYYGQVDTEIMRKYLKKQKIDTNIEELAALKRKFYAETNGAYIKPLPGAVELINALHKRKILLAVASSSRRKTIDMALKKIGATDKISGIISGDDITHSKPDPEIFQKAAKLIGIAPKNCIVFEDSVHGIEAAKRAEMKCAAVTTGTASKNELEKLHPDFIFDNLEQALPPELDKIIS